MLFGYDDPFLKQMATLNPAEGGDPSIPYNVNLNANFTSESECQGLAFTQAMYTGKNDSNLIRSYSSIMGSSILQAETPYFDGNQTQVSQFNPWNIDSPVNIGTDAVVFKSGLDDNSVVGVTITDIFRSGKTRSSGENVDYFGLNTMRFELEKDFYTINPDYNNYKYNGLVNLTTVKTAPILFSFTHFYEADPVISNSVTILNKDNNV